MTSIKINVDPNTIRPGTIGPETGVIYVTIDSILFPSLDWDDSPIVILGVWANAMVRLLQETSRCEYVHFMEGPYVIELIRRSSTVVEVRALDGATCRIRAEVQAGQLVDSLLAASEEVLVTCRNNGWSRDAKKLNSHLQALRLELKKKEN